MSLHIKTRRPTIVGMHQFLSIVNAKLVFMRKKIKFILDQWKGTKIISTFVAVGMGTPEGQTFNKTIYNEQFWILNISADVRYICRC